MGPTVNPLLDTQHALSSHAWNGDHSMLAVSMANSNERLSPHPPLTRTRPRLHTAYTTKVQMFEVAADKSLKKTQTLKEHDQVVCSLDWAPRSNLLLSCSHDRNAYVWKCGSNGTWEPSLVILRLNRAALCGRWSPNEAKFAVGSGAKTVCVCYYSEENDWWVSKQIKKQHASSVTDVSWHPGGAIIATASTDGRVRVFNARVKGVDDLAAPPAACGATKFGDCLLELDMGTGWVHGVRWSPEGGWLAFCTHQSRAYFCAVPADIAPEGGDVAEGGGRWPLTPASSVSEAAVPGLPLKTLEFLSESVAVGGGWGCLPVVLGAQPGGGWEVLEEVRITSRPAAAPAGASQFSSAMSVFKDKEKEAGAGKKEGAGRGGGGGGGGDDDEDGAVHYNCIMEVRRFGGGGSFSTLGMDGKLVVWEGASIDALMAKLGLQ